MAYNNSMLAAALYRLKRPFHLVKTGLLNGLPAQVYYRFPNRRLKIVAITGTDGKTTSSTMLYHVLKTAGYKVGLISTVGAYLGDELVDTGFHVTAPQPSQMFKFMRSMVDQGYTHLILETTSHGIYQYRTWGINPDMAGLTNISHEHWDYHLTYENYLEAKASLLRRAKKIFINSGDGSFSRIKKLMRRRRAQIIEYNLADKLPRKVSQAITARFPESFNRTNAHLVYGIAQQLEISDADFATAINTFPGVRGRMQWVPNQQGLQILVDFAHTPKALEEVLLTLRQQKKKSSRLIAVFGAAGLRDRRKRPLMAKIGVELADLVVLTAEDPRTEDVWSIIREMKEQLTTGHNKITSIADRQQAIQFTLTQLAKKGDIIGIFGKGHETTMCFGVTEYPWNDEQAIATVLKSM